MLFFKQATTSFSSPAAAAAAASAGVTGAGLGGNPASGAAATFAAFMAVCHRPLEHLHAQQQLRASAPGATGQLQDSPSFGGTAANPFAPAAAPLNPWQQQQQPGRPPLLSSPSSSNPSSPYASSIPAAAAGGPQQQQQQFYHQSGLQVQAAGAPPAAAQQHGIPANALNHGELAAAPGESDEEFARRLAGMYGGSQHGSAALSGRPSAAMSSAPSSRAGSMASQQQLQGVSSFTGRRAGSDSSSDSVLPSAPALGQAPSASMLPAPSQNPFRPAAAAEGNPFRPAAGSEVPSHPLTGSAMTAIQAAVGAGGPASAGVTGGSGGSSAEGADAELCVICLSNPREVGFLHGPSVHKCVCRDCAQLIQPGTPCPMCRQSIERVIGVY